MKKILIILSFLSSLTVQSQITRGAQSGEIYMSNDWYWDGNIMHRAVFRSIDNGEHVSIQYTSTNPPMQGDMMIGTLIGEPTIGCLYNCGPATNILSVSFDHGINWENRESYNDYTRYFAGEIQGLIFRGNSEGFFKSIDYAFSFELLPIVVSCPFSEVGFSQAEFFGIYKYQSDYYNFVHTLDYGQSCTEIVLDSTIVYWSPSGQNPEISRGTVPGELYLVSWWPDYHFKIFHTVDTGYSWTQKYESGYIDIFTTGVSFSAGREPGSFYVVKSKGDPTFSHLWLYIDYSTDYGETFATYFHDLDSTITNINTLNFDNIKIPVYPNPFKDKISIKTRPDFKMIEIFDSNGKSHYVNIIDQGNNTETFDLRILKKGIYILKIKTERQNLTKKIIKI